MPRRVEDADQVLTCSVSDVASIASLLRTLSFKKRSWFVLSSAGLRVCVEVGRSVQAHAFLQAQMFSDYTFRPADEVAIDADADDEGDVTFELDLGVVLECLDIFGSAALPRDAVYKGRGKRRAESDDDEPVQIQYHRRDRDTSRTAMRMSYAGHGHPLILLLEEGGTITRCEVTTLDAEVMLDLPFDDDQRQVKVILKSDYLRDALSEVDPSCERLTLSFTPAAKKRTRHRHEPVEEAPGRAADAVMRIEAKGNTGSVEMDFPFDRDVIEAFTCARETTVTNSYPFSNVLHARHALSASTKTSIRMDAQGLMSLQFMMSGGAGGAAGFVEFICVPLDDA